MNFYEPHVKITIEESILSSTMCIYMHFVTHNWVVLAMTLITIWTSMMRGGFASPISGSRALNPSNPRSSFPSVIASSDLLYIVFVHAIRCLRHFAAHCKAARFSSVGSPLFYLRKQILTTAVVCIYFLCQSNLPTNFRL